MQVMRKLVLYVWIPFQRGKHCYVDMPFVSTVLITIITTTRKLVLPVVRRVGL